MPPDASQPSFWGPLGLVVFFAMLVAGGVWVLAGKCNVTAVDALTEGFGSDRALFVLTIVVAAAALVVSSIQIADVRRSNERPFSSATQEVVSHEVAQGKQHLQRMKDQIHQVQKGQVELQARDQESSEDQRWRLSDAVGKLFARTKAMTDGLTEFYKVVETAETQLRGASQRAKNMRRGVEGTYNEGVKRLGAKIDEVKDHSF